MELFSINIIMLNIFILMSLLLNKNNLIESYSQVSRVGAIINNTASSTTASNNNTNSEIIIHNPGREGVFPNNNDGNNKTMSEYNVDDELTPIEKNSTEVFTGRASQMGGLRFPLNFNTKPISYRRPSMAKSNYNRYEKSSTASSSPIYVYPSYGSKSIDETYKYSNNLPPSTAIAMDRFSPGEAYGFQQYQKNKNKNNKGYDYTPPKTQLPEKPKAPAPPPSPPPPPPANRPPSMPPTAPSSQPGPVYVPPTNLYAFPPNIDSNYLPPSKKGNQRPVTSYLPPAAGGDDDFDPNSFIGPVNPKYLPSNSQNIPPGALMTDSNENGMPTTPDINHNHDHDHQSDSSNGSAMDDHDHHHHHDHDHDHDHEHDPHNHDHEHDPHNHEHDHHHDHHDHSHDMPSATMSDTPPLPTTDNSLPQMMTMLMEALKNNNNNNNSPPPPSQNDMMGSDVMFTSPDHDHDFPHDHDHDFHHDHGHDFHGQYGVDAYPEIIYDHDPHDHHHHDHDVVTTTEAPHEEHMHPRVTHYSYYYLGRKLWYIPLYFTVYFTFYVAALIIKSIGRHKVDFPNHIQKRSIGDMSHKEMARKVDKLTNFVMSSIDDFNQKYF